MTAKKFRTMALSFPEATEAQHMGHPDFRVDGKIFATLGPKEDWAMVKLTPNQQAEFMSGRAGVFTPATGAWGRRGATIIRLSDADARSVRKAMVAAWRNTAPKRLLE